MLSERHYWIILVASFVVFAALIWFVLIPHSVIEYNLGVNLFTSSVFMVMTIIFLSLMINLHERKKWKKVEAIVLGEIGTALEHIFRSMVPYYKNGFADWRRFSRLRPGSSEAFSEHLGKLLRGEIRIEREVISLLLENPKLREREFMQFSHRLSEIETKYFRFLRPEIVLSIIKIEKSLSDLEGIATFYVVSNAFMEFVSRKRLLKKAQQIETLSPDALEPMVNGLFHDILEEIENLHKLGIRIFA